MNTLNGYSKSTLTDKYVLTAAGGHLAVGNAKNNIPLNNGTVNTSLNADLLDGIHSSGFLQRYTWWSSTDTTKNADDLRGGSTFAYSTPHNSITTGTIVSFDSNQTGYTLQLQGTYAGKELYFRNRNGDKGTWNDWSKVIHSNNYTSYLGYIGTTAVQASSATQNLTGIGSINMAGDILIATNGDTGIRQLRMVGGSNDYGRIAVGATANNAGWMEIATCDDGTEPIYVRQYTGVYSSIKNNLTLLDAEGNTSIPKNLRIGGNIGITKELFNKDQRFNYGLAYWNSEASTETGTIIITLPNGFNNSMNTYEIDIYEFTNSDANYSDKQHSKLYISGYNYSSGPQWYYYGYHQIGSYNKGVRLGYNGSKCVIMLGTTSTKWSYPQVHLSRVITGFRQQTTWSTGYSISITTNESSYTNIYTAERTRQYFSDVVANNFRGNLKGTADYATTANNVKVTNSDSNDSYRIVWHSDNTLYSTSGIYCNPSTDSIYASFIELSRTSDHGLKVGSIRGTAVGSRTGQYIHMYERVHIGSPNGWGSSDAPTQGLSTYGGAWLATNNGNVGIGTTSPAYKLDVNGSTRISGTLLIGNNATRNYIAFYGTTGDGPGVYSHTYIGENATGTNELSELILFKGNDYYSNGSGPDRIRHIAAQHLFQIYKSTAFSGTFESICTSTTPVNVLAINATDITSYLSILPSTTNTYNLGGSSLKWANIYATTFTGDLSGNATSATSATKVYVNQHTNNDNEYPLVWSNQNNTNNALENQLYKSYANLLYNPKYNRITASTFKGELFGNFAKRFSFGGGQNNGKYYYVGSITLTNAWQGYHSIWSFTGHERAWSGLLYVGFRLSNTTTAFSGVQVEWLSLTDPTLANSIKMTYEDTESSRVVRIYILLQNYISSSTAFITNSSSSISLSGTVVDSYSGTLYTSSVGPISTSVSADRSITIVPHNNNEINFGGSNTSTTVYIGYRKIDTKPIPTSFVFGNNGAATLTGSGFIKNGSNDNYVLLGGGGHKAIGNATGNIPLSNGTVCTDLNADKLDGVHLAGHGGKAGVMRSWERGTYTTVNQYFGNGNVVVIDPKPTDSSELSANTIIFSLGDMSVRNTQLAFLYETDTIKYRRANVSTAGGTWNSWVTLLHSGNYSGFLDSRYYTETEVNNKLAGYLPLSGGTMTGPICSDGGYIIMNPIGASYHTSSDTHSGCITITLPAGIGNTMVSMWIDVYNYSTQTSFSVHCGGYTYSNSTWQHNPFAVVYGANHRVRLGHNGTNFVIYIGETNSVWSYPQVSVRNVTMGYSPSFDNWKKAWSVGFSTSVSNVTYDTTTYAWTTKNFTPSNYYTKTESDSRYVNVEGDTLTGALNFANGTWNKVGDDSAMGDCNKAGLLGIKSLNNNLPGIAFFNSSGTQIGSFYSEASVPKWNANTMWHAGNDGSGSDLDADKLDGKHLSDLNVDYVYTIDCNSLTDTNFYPIVFASSTDPLHCRIRSTSRSGVHAWNQNNLEFIYCGSGWSDTPHRLNIINYGCYSTTELTIGCIGTGNEGGIVCIWVRGGSTYYISSNRIGTLKTSDYTSGNEVFTVGTNYYGGSNTKVTVRFTPQSTISSGNYVNSNFKADGNCYAAHFYENSDIKLKTNIETITSSSNIPQLKSFDWKSDGSHSYGLIAQELEEMGYSELVDSSGEHKTVKYSAALSLIVGKLQVKIRELEKEIEILKNKN